MPRPSRSLDRLASKVAIVTGGGGIVAPDAPGIGEAIALLFGSEGAKLCVVDRDRARANHTVDAITQAGGMAISVEADISSASGCETAVADTIQAFGRVDVLVNNAAIRERASSNDTLDQVGWEQAIAVNLTGAWLMSRAAIAAMATSDGGVIVNIASVAALRAHGSNFAYSSSKAALLALTRDLAVAQGRAGIRVNAVCPGHMFTPIVADMDAAARARRAAISPIRGPGDAWDIASACLFLASDEARFISGTTLTVDGGVSSLAPLRAVDLIMEDEQ
ncbi:SDR family NAD(P)-dependent oxidoreductase [Novosphingobium endophyticum]|uniref:SDR family NAD(P)-dependent oxidoreductase n=1 Tax=Novosphingobium endophyticum TaxID=1955250 RepID=UPI00166E7096|nr:SDR family NAD(P)-dependent oxidoreductase [Novosphingobium endophyticum]